jgi:hypothetical protein
MRTGVLTILLTAQALAAGNVPFELSVQGVLRDGQGKLQSKSSTVSASLWDDQTAGNQLASFGPFASVAVVNGLFTVKLADSSLGAHLEGHAASGVWVELTVDGESYPRQKLAAEPYAVIAAEADGLSSVCSGCVSDSMINSISASKISGTLNAAQLNGKSDSAFEPALSGAACSAGSFYTSINGSGAVSCGAAVTSLGTAGGLSQSAGGAGAVNLSIDNTIQRAFTGYTDGNSNQAGACPAGSAVASANGAGSVSCTTSVASANNVTCVGCITAAKIQTGALQVNVVPQVSAGSGTTRPVLDPDNNSLRVVACDACPANRIAVGGSCSSTGAVGIRATGPNPFPNPQDVGAIFPSPSPDPATAPPSTLFCCAADSVNGGGGGTVTARASCLSFAPVAVP